MVPQKAAYLEKMTLMMTKTILLEVLSTAKEGMARVGGVVKNLDALDAKKQRKMNIIRMKVWPKQL